MAQRQDTIAKRRQFSRSDAVVGDDDNKLRSNSFGKKRSTTSSHSKDSLIDSTGVEIMPFIESTLHKNAKDREFMLETEEKLRKFLLDESEQCLVFPSHSSYNRMMLHRIAEFFGLLHNVDQDGHQVVVSKYSKTKMPNISFKQLIKHDNFRDNFTKRMGQSFDESRAHPCPASRDFRARVNTTASEGGGGGGLLMRDRRARSFEQPEWYGGVGGGGTFHGGVGGGGTFNGGGGGTFYGGMSGSGTFYGGVSGSGGLQQQASAAMIINNQFSAMADYGTERVNSNGSSTESAAIPLQMQPLQLPMLTSAQCLNEASLISPSINLMSGEPQQPGQGKKEQGGAAPSPNEPIDPGANHQRHIPSLFAIHPSPPPPFYPIAASQYYPLYGYQMMQPTTLYSPTSSTSTPAPVLSPAAALPSYYAAAAPYFTNSGQFYYANQPTQYQQQSFIHPLLEDNENQQQLVEQLENVELKDNCVVQQDSGSNQQNQQAQCASAAISSNEERAPIPINSQNNAACPI